MEFYNIKEKIFNGQKQIIVYSIPIKTGYKTDKEVKRVKTDYSKLSINQRVIKVRENFKRSSRRSKNMIYDIARSNVWEWFVTLTFNPEKVNSFDYDACTKKLSKWLNNTRTKCGDNFRYIVIPELHQSGRYHFHGLMSGCDGLKFEISGHKSGEDDIYNIGGYKLGFTTATRVKDTARVSMYIAKYVTKELTACTKGKRRYWASKNCDKPLVNQGFVPKIEHTNLHFSLVNDTDFQFAQEKEMMAPDGKEGYIRYYEFVKGNVNNVN
jgi:hypothetical protein